MSPPENRIVSVPTAWRPSTSGTKRYWQYYERTPVAWPMHSIFPDVLEVCSVAIVELKIVNGREHDRVLSDWRSGSVRELEAAYRRWLKCYLPLQFDDWFYNWTMMFKNNGSFRSHQVFKSQWSIMKLLLLIYRKVAFFFSVTHWSHLQKRPGSRT